MNEKILSELRQTLGEKQKITGELKAIARPDERVQGDWHVAYQDMGDGRDEDAQEVTEYATCLPPEHDLGLRFLEVKGALQSIIVFGNQ